MPRISTLLPLRPRPGPRAQRGAATLIVVMVLFFIVALVAAYTSRNLIFEQRTSANQYSATQAFEAAEAGLEWALAMLNGGRITDQCVADTATVADPTFRQRYLEVSATDGSITVLSPGGQVLTPGCVLDSTGETPQWRCECPRSTAPALMAPAGTAVAPAFRVRFVMPNPALRPDLVRIESNGCTRLDDACLNFPSQAVAGSGRASVSVLASLRSALPRPPHSSLTAGGNVDGTGLTVVNNDAVGPNIAVHAGGNINPDPVRIGPPGTPSAEKLGNAAVLKPTPLAGSLPLTQADRFFVAHFGLTPALYREQPAAVRLSCDDVACTGAALRSVVELNPGRVVWVDGNIDIDSSGDIGTPDAPVMLVLTGNLTISATDANLHGVVYGRVDDWTITGPGRVLGAAIAQDDVSGAGAAAIVYDRTALDRLRLTHGSFVRVPGSWRDFE